MGPLVYYARWRGAKLRLAGRDEQFVWGQLVDGQGDGANTEPFRFDNYTLALHLGEAENQRTLQLDEMGVVVSTTDPPSTTNAGAEP